MRFSKLGEKGRAVKEQVASALNNWEPRKNKPIKIVDVRQDMATDAPGTLEVVVKTHDRKRWSVRIDHGTFIDAVSF